MESTEHFLTQLIELPNLTDPAVRRGVFRQAFVRLGQSDATAAPMALAGVAPDAFAESVRIAMADGLFEDLTFLREAAAASALHQMTSALPHGTEKRALGRMVLRRLYEGDAETFATLASRMALSSTKALDGAGVHARVQLCLELRGDSDSATNRLALAITERESLSRTWIVQAATGSLPERRMAAQLFERAAREVSLRALHGDAHALRPFCWLGRLSDGESDGRCVDGSLEHAWRTLLDDRESLVWRHVAVARGRLRYAIPRVDDALCGHLSEDLSPTEWRRAATSLVASIASARSRALDQALDLLNGRLLQRDPGIATAMVWGLMAVAEVEPEAADELLDALAQRAPLVIAESLLELRVTFPELGRRASALCADALRAGLTRPERDDAVAALAASLVDDLERDRPGSELGRFVASASEAFAQEGPRKAYELARVALSEAKTRTRALAKLEVRYDVDERAIANRRAAMLKLRELDAWLFESNVLSALLLLDRAPGVESAGVEALDDLHKQVFSWLLAPERRDAAADELDAQSTLYQREIRALLHLVDGGQSVFSEEPDRRFEIRQRWFAVVGTLTSATRRQPRGRHTRALLATVARTLDAIVRDGVAEPVDAFLFVATTFADPGHVTIMAEASMHRDVTALLTAYTRFATGAATGGSPEQLRAQLAAFRAFLAEFPCETSLKSEALRTTCMSLAQSLEAVLSARSLRALLPTSTHGDRGALGTLEDALLQLRQLVAGAERRCTDRVAHARAALRGRLLLHRAVAAAVQATESAAASVLFEALTMTTRMAEASLPGPIATLVGHALTAISKLGPEGASLSPPPPLPTRPAKLPDWVPARRVVGGFFIERPLGGGNVGSVFVVVRADERNDRAAPRFALKVPEYSATVARSMSESDFLRFFREEAGALLAIPEHPNLAGFVTFDAGARPKPILVMELVEGPSCEAILESRALSVPLAIRVLEGMLDGLDAMHAIGIAHLDVKPSNVILRDATGAPVLVDFGLAGRKVRPGCATLCYGAPEIWSAAQEDANWLPASSADIYAFGCCAFELLTNTTLFDAATDVAILAEHAAHDGRPSAVLELGRRFPHLADFIAACIRRDPRSRASAKRLRDSLDVVRSELEGRPWPLAL